MGRLLSGFLAMREADLVRTHRIRYWRSHPEESEQRRRENCAFRYLTEQETAHLEANGCLPSDDTIIELAECSGLTAEHILNVCKGFAYLMNEGLRIRPSVEEASGEATS